MGILRFQTLWCCPLLLISGDDRIDTILRPSSTLKSCTFQTFDDSFDLVTKDKENSRFDSRKLAKSGCTFCLKRQVFNESFSSFSTASRLDTGNILDWKIAAAWLAQIQKDSHKSLLRSKCSPKIHPKQMYCKEQWKPLAWDVKQNRVAKCEDYGCWMKETTKNSRISWLSSSTRLLPWQPVDNIFLLPDFNHNKQQSSWAEGREI